MQRENSKPGRISLAFLHDGTGFSHSMPRCHVEAMVDIAHDMQRMATRDPNVAEFSHESLSSSFA